MRDKDPDGDSGSEAHAIDEYMHDGKEQILHNITGVNGGSHVYMGGPLTDMVLFDQTDVLFAYLGDHLGTVREVLEYNGSAWVIDNHLIYDSFGNRTETGTATISPFFGFTGRPWDKDTALQYNWHRWYDANAGRWISEDPIGFRGGQDNLSAYVLNSPLRFIDPTGLRTADGIDYDAIDEHYVMDFTEKTRELHTLAAVVTTQVKAVLDPNEILDKIVFAFGDRETDFDAKVAARAGFAIGHRLYGRLSGTPDDKGLCRCDFSGSIIKFMTYHTILKNHPRQRPIHFVSRNRDHFIRGPEDSSEHELWHARGLSTEFRDEVFSQGILLIDDKQGFWGGLFRGAGRIQNAVRKGIYASSDAECKQRLMDLVELHLTGAAARAGIVQEGAWHSAVKWNATVGEFYDFNGRHRPGRIPLP